MPSTSISKQIAKNTLMLYMRLLFSMAISLYTSRVILNALGVEDFGIYNVVAAIVVISGFLNNAVSAATQRFLTFELGKADFFQLERVFKMSITIHILIAIGVLILSETIGLWLLNTHLNIPNERMNAANWAYQFSIFSFLISIIYAPFTAALISHEKFNVFAYINIIEVILKLLIAFIITWFGSEKLILYSALIFIVTIIVGILSVNYSHKNFNECKFAFLWNKELLGKISSFASWNLLGVIAGITSNQGVNLILNMFFGPTINAARGIAFQIHGAVNSLVTNFQLAVNPPLIKSYASGDKPFMHSLIFSTSKYSFFILFAISLPLLLETEYLLGLWLKVVPEYSIIFTQLVIIDILICSLSGSLQTTAQASGNIKLYQTAVSGILLLNLPSSYIFLKFGFPPDSTFVVSIVASILALFTRLIILKKIIAFPVGKFLQSVIYRVLSVFFIASIIPYYLSSQLSRSIENIVFILLLSVLSVLTAVWIIGLNGEEKMIVKKKLVGLIK